LIRAARRRAGTLVAGIGLALWLMPAVAQERVSGLGAPDLFALAERNVNADRPADALAIYAALTRDPDIEVRSEARFRRGMLLGALKRYAEAAVEFRAFLDEKPGVARVELELARVLTAMGNERAARRALRQAQASGLPPDVAVVDIAMPQLNGLEAARQVMEALPATRIIMLSAHSDDAYVEQATAAGAVGYLIKQTSSHDLCKAIREVQKGHTFFSPSIDKHLKHQYEKLAKQDGLSKKRSAGLSAREAEVLQLIAEGKANKETAAELNISIKTVEKHRQHLMEKLNIHDTAGLTRYAIASGIIESSVQLTII